MNATLEWAEAGTPLRLVLKGGSDVRGEYLRHDAERIVLLVDGEERVIERERVADVLLSIIADDGMALASALGVRSAVARSIRAAAEADGRRAREVITV
jgi:hypothetical protein